MSTVPGRRRFIGDTIGVHFDRIVERFAERDALIVRHQQVRWTFGS
jgi:fatty-acyl-CoA synthase